MPAFAYIHTPARYIWEPALDTRGSSLRGPILNRLRRIDAKAVHPGVTYAVNSKYIRTRVERTWGVASEVIYPPVEVEQFSSATPLESHLNEDEAQIWRTLPSDFVLGASRLVPYKRVELAIKVAELLNLPAVVAGDGPDVARIQQRAREASVPVHLVGRVSMEMLRMLLKNAQIYVFMGVEDFGIMPVEAMASGTPVLVNPEGGAVESVELCEGGTFVDPDSPDATIAEAARAALSLNMDRAQSLTAQFSPSKFRSEIESWISN